MANPYPHPNPKPYADPAIGNVRDITRKLDVVQYPRSQEEPVRIGVFPANRDGRKRKVVNRVIRRLDADQDRARAKIYCRFHEMGYF